MNNRNWMIGLAAAAMLAACGGGDRVTVPEEGRAVPASATVSPAAYSAYVGSLPANDTAEALNLDGVVPPVSETAEPIALV